MGGLRIRWRGLAKGGLAALAGLLALQALPSLLRAPEPPPLGANVGLPRVSGGRPEGVPPKPEPRGKPKHRPRQPRHEEPATKAGEAGAPAPVAPPPPAPAPLPAAPPAPPPAPPSPLEPPPPPGDGSAEFAPH